MLLLTATTFAAASGIHYQTPMLGAMAAEFGVDGAAIGWIPTLTFGGFLVGILFLVPLGDKLDKRRLIITLHAAAVVALLAAAGASSLATAAAAGFVIGLCSCFAQVIVPLVAELAPGEARGRAVGTVLSALFLGILFARVTGALIARLPHTAPKTALRYPDLLASLLVLVRTHAEMRRVIAIQLCLGICYGGFWATIATMLLKTHGLGPQVAGLIGIPGAAGVLIARAAGRWLDLRGAGPVVVTGTSVIVLAYCVFAFGVWWPLALAVGAALLDCGLRATMVANQTLVNSLAPEARARSNTIFGFAVWSGNAVGAFVASSALAASGWLAVCAISVLAACAALAVQLRAMRR